MLSGLILAAGEGKRYGKPKALASCRNKSFLEIQYELLRPFCDDLVVVTGAKSNEVKNRHENLDVIWCENKEWENGQFSSLQKGLSCFQNTEPTILQLVDVLDVNPQTIELLINEYNKSEVKSTIIPTYEGHGGHPILLSKTLIEEILGTPLTSRLDEILKTHSNIVRIRTHDPSILRNINSKKMIK